MTSEPADPAPTRHGVTWDSTRYLRFETERTQPAIDLARRIRLAAPAQVIDLGCGPGNSTRVLAERWPGAGISGLDSSPGMLAKARAGAPALRWIEGDIASWGSAEPYDVVFSNAALQWVPDHERLLPRLLTQVKPGGALAFQVPANFDAPAHRLMRELGSEPDWRPRFTAAVREWHAETAEFYYEQLAPRCRSIELWRTEYLHVLSGPAAIVDWYRSTGLAPWLQALTSDAERARFLEEYGARVAGAFPQRSDGRVLFPFLRLFVIAYR